jgi:Glycogen recognition site of AMP-activated protein kinase
MLHCCAVLCAGSWCDWRENHSQLQRCASSGDWVAVYKMKVGAAEYKFNVDGSWKAAPGDPLVMDPEVRALLCRPAARPSRGR